MVEEFDLGPYMNTKYHKMSGGWKQRFLLAIAFLHDPELLFLDEPTTGLDPKAAQTLWNNIKGSKDENRTIVLTTHSMEEIERYCDRVIVLKAGEVVANDSPKSLIKSTQRIFHRCLFSFSRRWCVMNNYSKF